MELRWMTHQDRNFVMSIDTHVDGAGFRSRVMDQSGFVLWEDGRPVGLMHHVVLWDKMPFLNLLYVLERGAGQRLRYNGDGFVGGRDERTGLQNGAPFHPGG